MLCFHIKKTSFAIHRYRIGSVVSVLHISMGNKIFLFGVTHFSVLVLEYVVCKVQTMFKNGKYLPLLTMWILFFHWLKYISHDQSICCNNLWQKNVTENKIAKI